MRCVWGSPDCFLISETAFIYSYYIKIGKEIAPIFDSHYLENKSHKGKAHKLFILLWRIWPLIGNGSVNTFPKLCCRQQNKAWKREWSIVRQRWHTRYSFNCWRHIHHNDLLKHGYRGYVKWNPWRRWVLFGSREVIQQDHTTGVSIPCGGGIEYLHRNLASRRRRRKGKSRIWARKIWSRVPCDSDPKMTALARPRRNCKRQTRPLVRQSAPHQQTRKRLKKSGLKPQMGALFQDRLADWPPVVIEDSEELVNESVAELVRFVLESN
jgi:hypothetical protein